MTQRYSLLLIAMILAVTLTAQKEDANWVFGVGCGFNFQDPDNPTIFVSATSNFEASASISDTSGRLQFYYAEPDLINRDNEVLANGELRTAIEVLLENFD